MRFWPLPFVLTELSWLLGAAKFGGGGFGWVDILPTRGLIALSWPSGR